MAGDRHDTAAARTSAARRDGADRQGKANGASKADQRREAAQRREALKPLAKKIKETESLMERLGKRIQAIETQLTDPALYEKNPQKAGQLAKERASAAAELAEAEECWLALSGEYEEALVERI